MDWRGGGPFRPLLSGLAEASIGGALLGGETSPHRWVLGLVPFGLPGSVPALVLWVSSVLLLGFLVGVLAPLDLVGSVLGCLLVGTSEVSLGNLLGPIVTQLDLLRVSVAIWAPDNFDCMWGKTFTSKRGIHAVPWQVSPGGCLLRVWMDLPGLWRKQGDSVLSRPCRYPCSADRLGRRECCCWHRSGAARDGHGTG